VVASDDGVNVSAADDSSRSDSERLLTINDGYLLVQASGDGLDANGGIVINGGTVIVYGPASGEDLALDADLGIWVNGGTLIATGASNNMLTTPEEDSEQVSLLVQLSSSQSASRLFHLEDGDGSNLLSVAPWQGYQSVLFSSPDLAQGQTLSAYLGGRDSGTLADGVYSGGSYSAGQRYGSTTLSAQSNTLGDSR